MFYVHVNREGRKNPVDFDDMSPAPDIDPEEGGPDIKTRSWWEAEQEQRVAEGKRPPIDPRYKIIPRSDGAMLIFLDISSRDYIFDGKILHRDRPDYQLCDITDPLIAKYINDPAYASDTCDVRIA